MPEENEGETPENEPGTETEPNQQPTDPTGETPEELKAELEETRKALKSANRESATRRKKLEELEGKEKERQDAELSEMEKLQKQIDELNAGKEKAEKEARSIQIKAAVISEASILNFNDPKDAFALVDRSQFEIDGDNVAGVKEALQELAKNKPYMIKKAKTVSGNVTNPGDNVISTGETEAQQRARLYGTSNLNLFTPEGAKKHGGGVINIKDKE